MLVYFVRHGETPQNASGIFQGADSVLSPEGEIQAGKVAERLSKLVIDEIWSSPMARAKQTAEFINQYQKTKVEIVEELSELKRPSSVVGKKYSDPAVQAIKYPLSIDTINDPHFKIEDGESFADLVARARKLITMLESKSMSEAEDYTVLLTGHGFMLATLIVMILLGGQAMPAVLLEAVKKLKMRNTGISIAKIHEGSWRVMTISDFGHL